MKKTMEQLIKLQRQYIVMTLIENPVREIKTDMRNILKQIFALQNKYDTMLVDSKGKTLLIAYEKLFKMFNFELKEKLSADNDMAMKHVGYGIEDKRCKYKITYRSSGRGNIYKYYNAMLKAKKEYEDVANIITTNNNELIDLFENFFKELVINVRNDALDINTFLLYKRKYVETYIKLIRYKGGVVSVAPNTHIDYMMDFLNLL